MVFQVDRIHTWWKICTWHLIKTLSQVYEAHNNICYLSGDDRNFALESYGVGSKCFDHTERMWEERSCSQVRQWQHWGSGCYNYICEEQRLHMQVLNHTFTCFYPGQEIEVKLVDNDWLHTGSLICPACDDVCNEEFEAQSSRNSV